MQDLSDKVWNNPRFHEAFHRIELAWLVKELGAETDVRPQLNDGAKLMQAAAILACSESQAHRRAAFRAATCAYEYFGAGALPFDQALRVILARLGNYPSIGTRDDVDSALAQLPLVLATEEIAATDKSTITVNRTPIHLTDFQFRLWTNLISRHLVALSAPTSAGKSFVLQTYLSSLYEPGDSRSIVYIVPTRALIAQVAEDLNEQLRGLNGNAPDIVTVPVDGESPLADRAIYVMTQERIQLTLNAHADFTAGVIVVDEAQSIADGSRGILLQWVIDDLLDRNPKAQALFASPAIRNLGIFGELFGLNSVVELSSTEPTVAQNFLIVTVDSATRGKISVCSIGDGSGAPQEILKLELNQTTASRIDRLVHIPAALGRGQSNVIYANGAAEAEDIALQLADLFSDREPTEHQKALADLATEAVHSQYALADCVKRGVAFHYSNIPTQLRKAIEAAVALGEIDFLVCTSTLLQGVNLPAKNIFMCLPEKGKTKPLESTDFWNLSGRAGRLRREFQGNIFLIDYDKWKKKPLEGSKETLVVPAIASSVRDRGPQLLEVIRGDTSTAKADDPDLETTFGRLFSDLKRGGLNSTLDRIGFDSTTSQAHAISSALAAADAELTIPADILRKTPNISAHKQQRLYGRLREQMDSDPESARLLLPKHPREAGAFQSYADILELCHEVILKIDTSKNLHRFHAVIALKWMLGIPLPQIVDDQIRRRPTAKTRTTIRSTLEIIEGQIRFQAVRLFGCYNTLLTHALNVVERQDLVSSIPTLPLYLELGASDKTMISFIALGLSRVAAMKLNELSARKDLDPSAALEWLRTRPLERLGLSPLLTEEIRKVLASPSRSTASL
jgi:hypothetical protein